MNPTAADSQPANQTPAPGPTAGPERGVETPAAPTHGWKTRAADLTEWFQENFERVGVLMDEFRRIRPDWTPEQLEAMGQQCFLALAICSKSPGTWATIQRLAFKREELAFQREQFQYRSRTRLALGLDAVAQAFTHHPAALALYRRARELVEEAPLELGPVARPDRAAAGLDQRLDRIRAIQGAPSCRTFHEFLSNHARVLGRDGTGGPFSLAGRAPLALVVEWLDKILRNTLDGEPVELDSVPFAPGGLKGATLAVAGGAQFGKTVLELNLMAYATAVRFLSAGNYLPDRFKVEEIVDQKFRPNVLDLYPWMAAMIQLGKVRNASGKTINRKQSYTVTNGERKSFGSFCGMHKPPTSITLDLALLDEVDDIPDRNIGYVDARMTNSPVHLTCFIGTQRVAGAGQNVRLKASSFHVKLVPCPRCGREWCLEEEFPRCVRVRREGRGKELGVRRGQDSAAIPTPNSSLLTPDPIITAEMAHDRLAEYYIGCPECGAEMDRDTGRYVARHPERVAQAKLGVRVSQLNISAISLHEIIGAWHAAFADPSGNALAAFYCDRIAIPNAGAAQPITQAVLDDCRRLGLAETAESPMPYVMGLGPAEGRRPEGEGNPGGDAGHIRVAGMDMGPRCWFWCDEVRSPRLSACVWAEMMASGQAAARLPLLMQSLGVRCVLLDAGGEPDLTKRLVLALNGLDHYTPPAGQPADILKLRLYHLGGGLAWDGERRQWRGLRAAAVLFVTGAARGIEQTVGFTQDGLIYPLIKCQRGETIQTAVNDFLTPNEGVLELLAGPSSAPGSSGDSPAAPAMELRELRRARLPQTCAGPGVSQAVLDGHLLNLRKERSPRHGLEEWIDGVENHLGLAKAYARLAQTLVDAGDKPPFGAVSHPGLIRSGDNPGPHVPRRGWRT